MSRLSADGWTSRYARRRTELPFVREVTAVAPTGDTSKVFDAVIRNWQIVIPAFGTISGPFQISGLDFTGQHDRELTFDLSLESAGELVFTAA